MADGTPSVLLRNARIDGRDEPVDLLLRNGLIASITPAEAPASAGKSARFPAEPGESIDLEGRFVIPGLWDQHVHFTQWALTSRRLDVSAAESAVHAAAMVKAVAPSGAYEWEGGPLVGFGFRDGLWHDLPSRALLDEASGDSSVVLVSGDLHCVWLSTRAAADLGVEVDETGLLREDAAFAVERALDDVPDDLVDSWARQAGLRAAARGVVGFVDFEMAWNLDVWRRRRAAGFDTQRVRLGVYPRDLDRAVGEGLRTGDRIDELLEVGYLKVLIDGSLNTRTAYCFDPYPESFDDDSGVLTVSADELEQLVRRASTAGLVPAVHAIGDRAIGVALDVFQRVGCAGRIEHAQLVADDDLDRFSRLDVVPSVQPAHLLDDRDVAEHFWVGRTGRAFPLRSLLDAGARLDFGSDAPVAALDPWLAVAAAVERARPGRSAWHPEQAITASEALVAASDGRRKLEPGGAADLVVVESDPRIDPRSLAETEVVATLVGGRFTHRTS